MIGSLLARRRRQPVATLLACVVLSAACSSSSVTAPGTTTSTSPAGSTTSAGAATTDAPSTTVTSTSGTAPSSAPPTASTDSTTTAASGGGPTIALAGVGMFRVRFSPDGAKLLTWGDGPSAYLWDAATGKQLAVLLDKTSPDAVTDAAFSPDGSKVLTGHGRDANVWDVTTGQSLTHQRSDDGIGAVVFGAAGPRVVTQPRAGAPATVRDVGSDRTVTLSGDALLVDASVFCRDGATLVANTGEADVSAVWDTATGRPLATLSAAYSGRVRACSPDASLAASFDGAMITLFNTTTGAMVRQWQAPGVVSDLAFSPDGSKLASSGDAQTVIWDVGTGSNVASYPAAFGVTFSPSGAQLALAHGNDGLALHPVS